MEQTQTVDDEDGCLIDVHSDLIVLDAEQENRTEEEVQEYDDSGEGKKKLTTLSLSD